MLIPPHILRWILRWIILIILLVRTLAGGATNKRNFSPCCELSQEIGGNLDYQNDPRWKEHRCMTVMRDLGPCFSACKEIHNGRVVEEMDTTEEANAAHHKFVIVTSHLSSTHEHVREIEQSICANLMSRHIARIIMLFEGTDVGCRQMSLRFPSRKLHCRSLPMQPTYFHLFEAANHLSSGTITIVANADVVFDDSLRMLWPDALRNAPTVMVLSSVPPEGGGYRGRYVDMVGARCPSNRLPPDECGQEGPGAGKTFGSFIFAVPLPSYLDLKLLSVQSNVRGAESLVAATLESAGMMLLNPCFFIKAQHWHCEAAMHQPTTVRVAKYAKATAVAPCRSCPFLRTAAQLEHRHSRSGGKSRRRLRGEEEPQPLQAEERDQEQKRGWVLNGTTRHKTTAHTKGKKHEKEPPEGQARSMMNTTDNQE